MPIKNSLAYCGLVCNTCPIFIATNEPDKSKQKILRESIAREITLHYGTSVDFSGVTDCDGCRANTGRLFTGCIKCEIRPCATAHQIENCSFCNSYPCKILEKHFELDPGARERLDKIRHSA